MALRQLEGATGETDEQRRRPPPRARGGISKQPVDRQRAGACDTSVDVSRQLQRTGPCGRRSDARAPSTAGRLAHPSR